MNLSKALSILRGINRKPPKHYYWDKKLNLFAVNIKRDKKEYSLFYTVEEELAKQAAQMARQLLREGIPITSIKAILKENITKKTRR
jgi:hypothetical protein